MRVLVVEDHARLAETIATVLRRDGVAGDGGVARERTSLPPYDVALRDRDLPIVHGDEVCRALATGEYPGAILMLTAAAAIEERVEGLGLGADDYLPKP